MSFERPHTLVCCHSFCELCIKHSGIKECPSCLRRFTGNKLIPFKALCFENLYLPRLTKVYVSKEHIAKGTCKKCKINSTICTNCYVVGCKTCNKSQSCTEKLPHNFCSVNLNETPEYLLQYTLKQICTTHYNNEVTNYCYMCHKKQCRKCLKVHENHKSDTIQTIKEKLLKYIVVLQQSSGIQQMLHQKISDLEHHKELLHKQYRKEYTLTDLSYDHKIHKLCQEKQIVLSRLMAFWSITNRAVENYKTEIQNLQELAKEFCAYFVLLIEKSSDKEIIKYFIKEKRQSITDKVVAILKEALHMIHRENVSFLQEKHILQKFKEQKETVRIKSFVCTDLSAIPHSRAGRAYKQEYQCLNYEDKLFKMDQIQVNIFGEEHSMFTLPLTSSKLVHTTMQDLMVVSKCAHCLSQLQLFSRALGKKYPEFNQNKIVKSLNNYLLNSNEQLFSVTADAIIGIKTAIMHLQTKDVSLYCKELNKNLSKLDSFIKTSNDYYLKLEIFYFEQQKLHINCDETAVGKSIVIYTSMLLDIMMDCRMYITNTRQICEKLHNMQKLNDILCKEGRENESHEIYMGHANSNDNFKKLITSHGFQLQIVLHYSTWVALNEICKTTAELITSWNLERTPLYS